MVKILVVDDDESIAAMIHRMFEFKKEYTVLYVVNGGFALPMLGLAPPPELADQADALGYGKTKAVEPDLVILDCMMPILDGWSLANLMSVDERTKRLPVILLTNKGNLEQSFRQLPNVVAFLTKPISRATLAEAISTALARTH